MHIVIKNHVMPLVGRVVLDAFDARKFGHCMSLQTKMQKHISQGNAESLKKYLAFCIQTWPDSSKCPIDMELIKEAIEVIEVSQ